MKNDKYHDINLFCKNIQRTWCIVLPPRPPPRTYSALRLFLWEHSCLMRNVYTAAELESAPVKKCKQTHCSCLTLFSSQQCSLPLSQDISSDSIANSKKCGTYFKMHIFISFTQILIEMVHTKLFPCMEILLIQLCLFGGVGGWSRWDKKHGRNWTTTNPP